MKIFSRPVSSGWKPVPTSRRLPTRPWISAQPAGGAGDAGKNFEEGGFAGAVAADEAKDFAFLDVEGDVFQGPESFVLGAAECGARRFQNAGEMVAKEHRLLKSAALVALAEAFAMDHRRCHERRPALENG